MRRVGETYEETKGLSLKEVAGVVRQRLQVRWPHLGFSVRCSSGRVLTVTVTRGWNDDVLSPAWLAKNALLPHHTEPRVSLHAKAAAELLQGVEVELARYNFLEEEPHSDALHVRFHAEVVFDSQLEALAAAKTVRRLQATLTDARVSQRSGDLAHLLRVVEALQAEAQQ